MQILSFSQARAGLKQAMDDVCRDHEPAVITRQRGDAVVLVSLTDYNAMAETMYLLGTECTPHDCVDLLQAIKPGKRL